MQNNVSSDVEHFSAQGKGPFFCFWIEKMLQLEEQVQSNSCLQVHRLPWLWYHSRDSHCKNQRGSPTDLNANALQVLGCEGVTKTTQTSTPQRPQGWKGGSLVSTEKNMTFFFFSPHIILRGQPTHQSFYLVDYRYIHHQFLLGFLNEFVLVLVDYNCTTNFS